MTSQSPTIYIYKITFEEVLYYYYGVHKEKRFNEYYMGSPETHKWMWDFYTPKKQILQFFDFTDEGWIEALEVEERLIRPFYRVDKWCLNEACGGKFSIDVSRKNGQKTGQKMYEERRGLFALTPEGRSEIGRKTHHLGIGVHSLSFNEKKKNGKKGGKKSYELGLGVHGRSKEKMTEDGKKGGKISAENHRKNGTGFYGLTYEQRSENGKRNGKIVGKRNYENKTGCFSLTPEKRSEVSKKGGKKGGKTTGTQKWMCLETGYITTPGPLSRYQKKRGIDTSKRVRVS